MKAVIALGANLGDPCETFKRALEAISERAGEILAQSAWHETEPLLHPESSVASQPVFLNGAVLVETELEPKALLSGLLDIERLLGRDRTKESVKWGPRVIDLDLIFVDQHVVNTEFLKLPHPEMHKRDFVLRPLLELSPEWCHPILAKTVKELWQDLGGKSYV